MMYVAKPPFVVAVANSCCALIHMPPVMADLNSNVVYTQCNMTVLSTPDGLWRPWRTPLEVAEIKWKPVRAFFV